MAQDLQRSDVPLYRLEAIDFGRRMAVEKEIEKTEYVPQPNAVFDESSNFIIYATLLGIKVRKCPIILSRCIYIFCSLYLCLTGVIISFMLLRCSFSYFGLIFSYCQVINLHTNKVSRILGKVESNDRFLRIALYQGDRSSKKVRKIPAAAANANESKEPLIDPTLLCCAFKKHRIYLFRYCICYIVQRMKRRLS